jgi:hypothetical protein
VDETTPIVESPPATPFTDQDTVLLEAPLTVAVNCRLCPALILEAWGVISIEMGLAFVGAVLKEDGVKVAPQPSIGKIQTARRTWPPALTLQSDIEGTDMILAG